MFQLAQVMWCLITHCQPPDGPVPELVSVQPQGSDEASDDDQDEDQGRLEVTRHQPRRGKRVPTVAVAARPRPPSSRTAPSKAKAKQAGRDDKVQGPAVGKKKWTYGNYICHDDVELFKNVDVDLRRLVMRCMMDEPVDRPGMAEIRRTIDEKLYQQWSPNDTDVMEDMEDCYHGISFPTEHPKGRLDRVRSAPTRMAPNGKNN
jgi:hypothetical protein